MILMRCHNIHTALKVLHTLPGVRARGGMAAVERAHDIFVAKYRDLELGWFLAREFAQRRRPFPVTCIGSDRWVYRAYAHQLGQHDPIITEARAIQVEPSLRNDCDVLRAALITKDLDVPLLSQKTGVPIDVILAFEKLFFNVIDRHEDAMYLRSAIYPGSRFCEMYEDYAEHEAWGALLMRVGFNRGLESVLLMAGLTQGHILKTGDTGAALADQLECTIMANALLLVHAGLGHGKNNAVSLNHAKSILTAAKQGGADTAAGSPVTTTDNNDPLLTQMLGFLDKNKRERATARQQRLTIEADVLPVD